MRDYTTSGIARIVMSSCVLAAVVLFGLSSHAGFNWDAFKRKAKEVGNEVAGTGSLSNDEVIRGLKQALEIGAKNASGLASKVNGYYKNPRIFIPFPPEAKRVKDVAQTLGMRHQVDEFVRTLNRAAEEAAKEAAPIFVNAIKGMTIQDGFEILKGPDDAATKYLQRKTTAPLTAKFRPVVKRAINKVQVTKYWNPIVTRYNQVPFTKHVDPNLDNYVTQRALKGLFYLIGNEEKKIRRDPAARVTALLRRVFGS